MLYSLRKSAKEFYEDKDSDRYDYMMPRIEIGD